MMRLIIVNIVLGLLCASAIATDPTSPGEHLKRGIFEEEANKNYEKAAVHYRAAMQAKAEAVSIAGTALYRLAIITNKQGKREDSHKLLQQLVREYPDEKALVRIAQLQLEAGIPKEMNPSEQVDETEVTAQERAYIEHLDIQIQSEKDGNPEMGAPGYFGLGKQDPKSPATKAIHDAAHKGYTRAIKFLVNAGVPVDAPLTQGIRPLHSACTIGQVKSCETLLELGADIHAVGESGGWQAIHYASAWGRDEVIKFLISKGAKINAQIERPTLDRGLTVPTGTALHVVSRSDPYPKSVAMLISLGADVNNATSVGQTPLMAAARNNQPEIVKLLLDAGANMELQYNSDPQRGQTALHDAAWFGAKEAAKVLLEKGANPNARKAEGTEGYVPLHHTAIRDCLEFAKLLVKHGADVQAKDFKGNTALHIALQQSSIASDAYILWLLKQGLNPMQPNAKGEMPVNMASGNRVELIAKNSFYPQWAQKKAVSLVRRGSYIPAGGFAATNEKASPPNLDDFLKRVIGPNYAKRSSLSFLGGGEIQPALRILKLSNEENLIATEYKIASGLGLDPSIQAPDLQRVQLDWGDIVEIDPTAYLPLFEIEKEIESLVLGEQWLSESFPDTERGNVLVRVHLRLALNRARVAKLKAEVTYLDASTNELIPSIVVGKPFVCALEEVAGQRILRVVLGEHPSVNDWVFSYSLDGDSLALMRLRQLGRPKAEGEPPFQTGTIRFKVANPINPEKVASPGQTKAAAWYEAVTSADLDKAVALMDVPFSLDRRSVLKSKEELIAIHNQMVESKGKRPIPKYTIVLAEDAPKLDRSIFPKYEVYRITVGKESTDIYVSVDENPKVIGMSD